MTMASLKHAIATYQSSRLVRRPPASRYASSSSARVASPPRAASCAGIDRVRTIGPAHQDPAEIEQRVADSAHLPVDERGQLRGVPSQQHIVEVSVAVHDAGLSVRWTLRLQPLRERPDRGEGFWRVVVVA